MLRRVRSTCRRTPYVHTEGTENENIRHKNHNFSCVLAMLFHSQKASKSRFFQKFYFREKVQKISFRMPCSDCSNSSRLFFSYSLKSVPNLKSGGLGLEDLFKQLSISICICFMFKLFTFYTTHMLFGLKVHRVRTTPQGQTRKCKIPASNFN